MTFQPPDWWYESWVGEWVEEGFSTEDVPAEAEDAGQEEQG